MTATFRRALRASPAALLAALALATCALASGCGSSGNSTNTGTLGLAFSPGNLSLAPGGSGTVQLSLTPSAGLTGITSLTLSDAPDGLSFSPTTVAEGASEPVTLTFTASASVLAGSYSITLDATQDGADGAGRFGLTITN